MMAPPRRWLRAASRTPAPPKVWRVLTDYDRLAEFVPNLERCERVPCPRPGRVSVGGAGWGGGLCARAGF